jgi:hypothetical protein
LAIQSIVVVTSPIGDQAPPALAAITTRLTYQMRSSRLVMSLRRSVTRMIVAVRLSMTEDRINPPIPVIHSSLRLLCVRTAPLRMPKP